MIELVGKYNNCKVFTDTVDNSTIGQIQVLLNLEYLKDAKMRFMPDCHAGKGCTVGTVIDTTSDKICPSMIGVDIGCSILATKIFPKNNKLDLEELDKVIHEYIPCGRNIHNEDIRDVLLINQFSDPLPKIKAPIDIKKARRSLGTLGGGNHFIEVDKDSNGNYWLLIHTGSRYLGVQVCKYYQDLAWIHLKDKAAGGSLKDQTKRLTEYYKSTGETKKLSKALSEIRDKYKAAIPEVAYEYTYLEGDIAINYIRDFEQVLLYSHYNRYKILDTICNKMHMSYSNSIIETPHNFISEYYEDDILHTVIRKGSISAKENEFAIIPLNMRDGSLLVRGKGNKDWLCSAPHGAGRLLSRKEAKDSISMKDYKDSMEGIYSTCISRDTVDESCFAYKDSNEIITNIQDTVEIIDTFKPVYNFKAGDE